MNVQLAVLSLLVFFGTAILGELHCKENERANDEKMDHSAFVQQELGDKPNDEQ